MVREDPNQGVGVARQKLDYIHFNPVSSHWKLSKNDPDCYYSSARFYKNGVDDFGVLFDLYQEFDGDWERIVSCATNQGVDSPLTVKYSVGSLDVDWFVRTLSGSWKSNDQ